MHKLQNINKQKFFYLTAQDYHHTDKSGHRYWTFTCECGNTVILRPSRVKSGHNKSCGCFRQKQAKLNGQKTKKHGMATNKPRLYRIWKGMRTRCNNPNNKDYKNYGGRGIKICKEWDEFLAFYKWAISHNYADNLEIDRENNNKNYEPSNCRWVDDLTQRHNRRK